MARKLTVKQENYKNARIAGNDPSDAYDIAYPTHKMNRKAVSVAAQKLEKHPVISLAINKARQNSDNRAIMTREKALESLTSIAETVDDVLINYKPGDDPRLNVQTQLTAIKQLGEMQGWEAPKKVTGDLTIIAIERKIIDSHDADN